MANVIQTIRLEFIKNIREGDVEKFNTFTSGLSEDNVELVRNCLHLSLAILKECIICLPILQVILENNLWNREEAICKCIDEMVTSENVEGLHCLLVNNRVREKFALINTDVRRKMLSKAKGRIFSMMLNDVLFPVVKANLYVDGLDYGIEKLRILFKHPRGRELLHGFSRNAMEAHSGGGSHDQRWAILDDNIANIRKERVLENITTVFCYVILTIRMREFLER